MAITVIVPAAGVGARFGGLLPKQFQQLADKPLIQHVIERFILNEHVTRVIVPVTDQLLATVKQSPGDRVMWIAGGETRQQSVIRGLAATGQDAELVVVHDAVRPLFRTMLFNAVVVAAYEVGAALPVIPVSDTIHLMNDDATIASTPDRSNLAAAQTPQCFRIAILRDVLERAQKERIDGTDEAGLAARFGYPVKAVPGDPFNIKITRPEDMAFAESYLATWSDM